METQRSFRASEVQDFIDGDAPSERTVRNTLDAMVSLGFLEAEGGTGSAPKIYYPKEVQPPSEVGGYVPRKSSQSGAIPYPGAKSHLSGWIIDKMPAHDTYVEVFGGGAGVLFSKSRSKYEIYNDLNDDLTQFFEVLRDRVDDLAEWLQAVPYSRSLYEDWVAEFYQGSRPDDPVERAGRFFSLRYMQYLGVASNPNGFKTRARRSPARTFDNARQRLQVLADRFNQVIIENRDYREILSKYDDSGVDVLFYLDPPYASSEQQYPVDFDAQDFIHCLQAVESDWIVSYSTVPDELSDYTIVEQRNRHRMSREANNVRERLICNFNPEERTLFREMI